MIAVSQQQAADTLGCDARTFARWLKRGCPGRPREYVIRDCIEWARENAWDDDSTLIAGATGEPDDIRTAYLQQKVEKLRRENTLSDQKIAKQNESLVNAAEVKALLTAQANLMRSALESLERRFGREALDIVVEILDEMESHDLTHAMD